MFEPLKFYCMFVPEATHAVITYVNLYYVPLVPCSVWIECKNIYVSSESFARQRIHMKNQAFFFFAFF